MKSGMDSFNCRSNEKTTSSALKSRVGVKKSVVWLDARAKVESVLQPVLRGLPAFGQAGHDLGVPGSNSTRRL